MGRSGTQELLGCAKAGRGKAQALHTPVHTLAALCKSDAAQRWLVQWWGAQRSQYVDGAMITPAGK